MCGRLSWLPVSFLLHVKYTLSYRIVLIEYMNVTERRTDRKTLRDGIGRTYA